MSDNVLGYAAKFRSKCRLPALTYIHSLNQVPHLSSVLTIVYNCEMFATSCWNQTISLYSRRETHHRNIHNHTSRRRNLHYTQQSYCRLPSPRQRNRTDRPWSRNRIYGALQGSKENIRPNREYPRHERFVIKSCRSITRWRCKSLSTKSRTSRQK